MFPSPRSHIYPKINVKNGKQNDESVATDQILPCVLYILLFHNASTRGSRAPCIFSHHVRINFPPSCSVPLVTQYMLIISQLNSNKLSSDDTHILLHRLFKSGLNYRPHCWTLPPHGVLVVLLHLVLCASDCWHRAEKSLTYVEEIHEALPVHIEEPGS